MAKNITDDPHFKRESSKYENPIPSREFILDFLKQHTGPARFPEIMEGLGLVEENDLVALSRRLKAMERDGQVLRNRKGAYAPIDKLDLTKGKILAHKDGFGFFTPDSGGDDWFVSPREMRKVFHGERVVCRSKGYDSRGRVEAKIVEILESEDPIQIVGRYFEESGVSFVKPNDQRFAQDILIQPGMSAGAEQGQVVVARITTRPSDKSQPVGAVVQVLGEYLAPGMEIEVAIHNYGIRRDWPDDVLNEIQHLSPEVAEKDKRNRVDLRHLPLVTIDGEDARDFDDAVYCEWKDSGGWRLWVAIADVSHYVQTGSALDNEGKQRGNSVYFPEYVVPMLPEQISNGLCSLNPHVDRLCMVCEATISEKGKLSGYKFYPAVMHSKARLTYNKVWSILNGDESLRAEYAELVPHLEELYDLYKVRAKERQKRGAIEFETTETQIVFNEDRKIDRVVPVVRNDAHRIIEECMICANIAAARYFLKHKTPGMFRVHEGPTEKKLEDLRSYLSEMGIFLFGGDSPEPKDYSEVLKAASERPDAEQIQVMLLRSMNQAVYTPDNEGHFGLAFNAYTHFTSPIRRYPDLIVHRLIKNHLKKSDKKLSYSGAESYSHEALVQAGETCSATERNADMATREVVDWLKCEFMSSHIGHQYDGEVVAITSFGMFVRIPEFHIDGLVHISSLGQDYFHYQAGKQRLVGEASGVSYRLGDSVRIEVSSVDLEDRKIDFELISSKQSKKVKPLSEREKLYARAKQKVSGKGKDSKGKSGKGKKDGSYKKDSNNKKGRKKTNNKKSDKAKPSRSKTKKSTSKKKKQ
ncbi:ribonuclease R [Pleionea sediminis]|uniref:ribonuclease R n=1 Tax=Pleionea sediminis TaxID=2569479 RepID=UPI001186F551|nr:ribonuclease R [Pleionea sediminis]